MNKTVSMPARWLALLVFLLAPGMAAAEAPEPHWYVSLNAGEADPDERGFDEADTAAVYLGYQFAPHVGVEVGYVDFDDFDFRDFQDTYVEADGYEISMLIRAPLGHSFEIFGKVGTFVWEADGVVSGVTIVDDDGHSIVYGGGFAYSFSEHVGLRLSALKYEEVSEGDIASLTFGIDISF